jgi:hypothetical protein
LSTDTRPLQLPTRKSATLRVLYVVTTGVDPRLSAKAVRNSIEIGG